MRRWRRSAFAEDRNLNILAGIVILYLGIAMLRGFFRGFLKTLFSMFFFILVVATAVFAAPTATGLVKGSREVTECVEEQSEKFLESQGNEAAEGLASADSPQELTLAIVGSALEVNGVKTVAAEKITDFVLNVIGFLAALIVSVIFWVIIEIIMNRLTRHRIISPINHVLGLLLGLVRGMIFVWLIFGIISALQFTEIGGTLEGQIRASAFLTWIDRGNFITRYIPHLFLSMM